MMTSKQCSCVTDLRIFAVQRVGRKLMRINLSVASLKRNDLSTRRRAKHSFTNGSVGAPSLHISFCPSGEGQRDGISPFFF